MNTIIIIIIGLIVLSITYLSTKCTLNNFSNMLENFDNVDYFTNDYVNLYDNTFDYDDMYKNDIEIIINKVIKNINNKDISILDAGCGLGKHLKYIYKKYNTIAIDRSKNMLNNAKKKCPNATFLLGDIINNNLFDSQSFNVIYSLLDSLYHNNQDNQIDIIKNFHSWLKPNGYLCVHIFNKNKLDPGPMPFTQYSDVNNINQAVTHFDDYSHIANFNIKDKHVEYNEIYERDGLDNLSHVTKLFIDNKNNQIETILSIGFKLIEVYSLKNIYIPDFELYVFKKI